MIFSVVCLSSFVWVRMFGGILCILVGWCLCLSRCVSWMWLSVR